MSLIKIFYMRSTIHDVDDEDDDLTNFPAHTHSASQGPPTAIAPENHYDGKHSCNDPGILENNYYIDNSGSFGDFVDNCDFIAIHEV